MKICWDFLNGLFLRDDGDFQKANNIYIYKENCKECNEPYLTTRVNNSNFCCRGCAQTGSRNSRYGKGFKNKDNPMWRGGIAKRQLASYESYGKELSFVEDVKSDDGVLSVRCSYCGVWYVPKLWQVVDRIRFIRGIRSQEAKFYCSDGCKKACPIFYKQKWPKGFKKATSREVQPELRQMVLQRDNYTCQYGDCGKTIGDAELHCHHITGVVQNPIESADVDNCITFCKVHHVLVHKNKGCGYHDLQCN